MYAVLFLLRTSRALPTGNGDIIGRVDVDRFAYLWAGSSTGNPHRDRCPILFELPASLRHIIDLQYASLTAKSNGRHVFNSCYAPRGCGRRSSRQNRTAFAVDPSVMIKCRICTSAAF